MQHFRIKIFAQSGSRPDLGAAIPVFHRWIQSSALPELLIDVADYRHVPAGPGVILVGHDAIYSLDSARNRLGLVYNRRTPADGSVQDRLRAAIDAARNAASLLEAEPAFQGVLRFEQNELEIAVNDRALAPNNDTTWETLRPDAAAVLDKLWGPGTYSLERTGSPAELFTLSARLLAAPAPL